MKERLYIGQVNVPVKSRGDSRSQRSVRSPETDVVQPLVLGTDVTVGFMKTVSWKVSKTVRRTGGS